MADGAVRLALDLRSACTEAAEEVILSSTPQAVHRYDMEGERPEEMCSGHRETGKGPGITSLGIGGGQRGCGAYRYSLLGGQRYLGKGPRKLGLTPCPPERH